MNSPSSSNFKNWPEEIASVYGSLPMPSLHEFVLTNEKFAAEMRRHGKDLHKMASAIFELKELIQSLDKRLNIEVIGLSETSSSESQSGEDLPFSKQQSQAGDAESEETETSGNNGYYPSWEVDMMRQATKIEERQWEEIYVAMVEVFLQTLNDQKELEESVLNVLKNLKNAKSATSTIEHLFSLHQNKTLGIKDQMMSHLKDLDIELIVPEIEDLYDEDFHRVVESTPLEKGHRQKKHAVARIVRIGYKRHGELVRQADVCIYE